MIQVIPLLPLQSGIFVYNLGSALSSHLAPEPAISPRQQLFGSGATPPTSGGIHTMKSLRIFIITLLFSLGLAGAALAQDAPAANADACLETYTPGVNYFPEQITVDYAEGFEVRYHESYKVVRVLTPWAGADTTFTYVLVQCGAPTPEVDDADAQFITVPVRSVVTLAATQFPHLDDLDLLDALVGVDEYDYVYNAAVRERIESGAVIEVGSGPTLNVEQVLDLEPELVIANAIGSPDYDSHPALIDAGLAAVINADYVEPSPLGRAEWVKFTALFFNAEAEAQAQFASTAEEYERLTALAAAAESRPTVMVNGLYGDTWYVAGGRSYVARLIADAGGEYRWADDQSTGGLPLAFEAVFDQAQDADIWINPNFWFNLSDGLLEDERYAEFKAFANGDVYNNNARVTPMGGNDYYELGSARPDLLLMDLIAIFHPDLLLEHTLFFYHRLGE